MRTAQAAKFGRFTSSPAPNYRSSVEIRIRRMAAGATAKAPLVGAVLFSRVTAARAFARRTAGIHRNHRHSPESGFVLNELPELREGPTVQNHSLLTPSPDPKANPLEILQGNCPLRAFGASNDL